MNASSFSTLLASLGGILMSLLAAYVPGFNTWFDKLSGVHKRLVMLGLIALSALASVGLTCSGFGSAFGLDLTCDQNSIVMVIQGFILAAMANQTAYGLTTASSTERKMRRKQMRELAARR